MKEQKSRKASSKESFDDDCALCKLMESGEGGDMEKLKKGFAEMAMRASLNPKSGIVVGTMPKK